MWRTSACSVLVSVNAFHLSWFSLNVMVSKGFVQVLESQHKGSAIFVRRPVADEERMRAGLDGLTLMVIYLVWPH